MYIYTHTMYISNSFMGGPHSLVAACHSRFFFRVIIWRQGTSHETWWYGHGGDQGDPGAVASASCWKNVHATNVAWLRARALVDGSPRYTFRAIRNDLSRSHLRLSHDNWTTDQWPKLPDRYPTGIRPLIPFANCGCRFQHPEPTTPGKKGLC